jgi:tellurite resistance protein TerB
MIGYLRASEQLKVFDQNDVVKLFQKYVEKLEFDSTIGIGEVMQAVGKFREKPQAQLIIRVCCAIGAADGNFDAQERTAVRKMASELGLNPADFSL